MLPKEIPVGATFLSFDAHLYEPVFGAKYGAVIMGRTEVAGVKTIRWDEQLLVAAKIPAAQRRRTRIVLKP